MLAIQNYGGFIMAVVAFQLIPGPGTITILNASARSGAGGGLKAVFGTLAGDFIYMLAAVLGLAAILGAHPGILRSVQWIGTGYLCWIGFKLLRATVADPASGPASDIIGWNYFRQALAVSLTNPKVIIFFMAFFPLFLGEGSTPLTLLTLMLHVTAISFLYQAGLVFIGKTARQLFSRWRYARRIATRLAGVALIGFGIKLAFNQR